MVLLLVLSVVFLCMPFTVQAEEPNAPNTDEQTSYTAAFDSEGGTLVEDMTVTADADGNAAVSLPGGPTKEHCDFIGWTLQDSADLTVYQPGTSVVITGNVTFKANWSAWPQVILYSELPEIVWDKDMHFNTWADLTEILPKTFTYTLDNSVIGNANIIGWQLLDDFGNPVSNPETAYTGAEGIWKLCPVYTLERTVEINESERPLQSVNITAEQTPGTAIDEAPGPYTFIGSPAGDVIIVAYEDDCLVITYEDGSNILNGQKVKTIYKLKNKTDITINGGGGDDRIYLNQTALLNTMTRLTVTGGDGGDTITTDVTDGTLDWSGADVELQAETVRFAGNGLTIKAKSLNVCPSIRNTEGGTTDPSSGRKIVIEFTGVAVTTTGDFTMMAEVVDTKDIQSTGTAVTENSGSMSVPNDTKVVIKEAVIEIIVDHATISADSIKLAGYAELMNTAAAGSIIQGMNVDTKISIKNQSLLNAMNGILVQVDAIVAVTSTGAGLSMASVNSEALADISGSTLQSEKGIQVLANNVVNITNTSIGGDSGGTSPPGGSLAVTGVVQNTKASAEGTSLSGKDGAATDITIRGIQSCTTNMQATMTVSNKNDSASVNTMDALLSFFTGLGYSDGTKVLNSDMISGLRAKYENALLAAAKEDLIGSGTSSNKVKNQQVGAFAANLVKGTNQAFIKNGQIMANNLNILAKGSNKNTTTADASGVSVEVNQNTSGIGAAAALNHTTYQNQAYLDGTTVGAAGNICIAAGGSAIDGTQTADTADSDSIVTAKAGMSKGEEFGVAGAIALNFYKGTQEAWLTGVTWPSSVGSLTVKVIETSNQQTLADGVPNNADKDASLSNELKAGNGAAIAYNVFDNRVQAYVTGCTNGVTVNGPATVQASSNGKNKAYAYCGSGKLQNSSVTPKTGKSLISSLGMNVLYQEVRAFLKECGTLTLNNGSLNITADTARVIDLLADSQKADADVGHFQVGQGNPSGVDSVALALNIARLVTEANLNSSIAKASEVNVTAFCDYKETVKSVAGLTGQGILNTAGRIFGIYDLMDNLYKCAQTVSGLAEAQGVPSTAPIRAKTYEFILDTAAAEAQSSTELVTKAWIGSATESAETVRLSDCGNVKVLSTQKGDFLVFGDGSTAADATIGTAAALGNYTMTNQAGIEKNAAINTSGAVTVKASNGNGGLKFQVLSGSGTSRGNTTGAGAIVLEKLVLGYLAYVNGNVTANTVNVEVIAKEESIVTAGSEKDFLNLLLRNEGTGMGAAFTYLDLDGSVKAEIGSGAQIIADASGDALKVLSDYSGTHTIASQSGGQSSMIDQKITAGKYALDASLALNIITLKVEALVNTGAAVTAGNGNIRISAKSKTKNSLSAQATQKAASKAAGASAAINLVDMGTHARMSGNAKAPKGKVSVKAEAASADDASAYASSKGVDVKDFTKSNGKKWMAAIVKGDFGSMGFTTDYEGNVTGGELSEDYRLNEDTGIAPRINNAFGIGVSAFQPISNGMLIKKTINSYKQDGNGNVKKDSNSKMVFAAAFGMNQLDYDTTAIIDGTVESAKEVEIYAANNNNFRIYATGLATSADKAISAAAALLMNDSNAEASAKNLGNNTNPIGSASIKAVTTNNMGVEFPEYKDAIAAQAMAAAKTAQSGQDKDGKATGGVTAGDLNCGVTQEEIDKSSTLGFAGGVAVIISGISTKAHLAENSKVYTDGVLLIQATEQAKLGARGWGGDYSKKSENSNEPKGIGAGIGLALIIADNQVAAYIGDSSQVTAGSVKILAERLRVDQEDYKFSWDLYFNLSFTDENGNLKPSYDTNVNVENLMKQFTDGLNYFASCNFYASGIGGAIASGGSLSGAGSFAILVLDNTVKANIGNHVTLVLLGNGSVDVEADSDLFVLTVTGSITTSGKTGIGASAGVNNATDTVEASIGNTVTVKNPGNVSVKADTKYFYIGVAAAGVKADKLGISGILILLNGGNTTKAQIGDNFTLTGGTRDVTVSASSQFDFYGIPVGVGFSKSGTGVGATVLVLNMKEVISATIGKALNITTTGNVSVNADSDEFLFSVVAGGGYAEKAEVAVNPATKVLDSQIMAEIGSGTIAANDVTVHAKGKVRTFAVSADMAASKKAAIGGVSDSNVFDQIILSYLDGTTLNLTGALKVEALSEEEIRSYVAGLAAGGDVAAQGSVSVQKLNNTVKAYLGDHTTVVNAANVNIEANDTVNLWILAGGIEASKSAAVGIANADVLLGSSVWAFTGNNTKINTSGDVIILAASNETMQVFVVGGSGAGKVAANGSVSVILITDSLLAQIGQNSVVTAGGNVQLKAEKAQNISALVGVVSGAGTAAMGASSNTVKINGTTKASILDGATVTASGTTAGISVNDGINGSETAHQGILIGSRADTVLKNLVVGGSGAGTVAAGASANVIVFESTTENAVGKATLTSQKDIVAAAIDNVIMHDIVGSVQGAGTAAVGAAVDVVTMNRTVKSVLGDGSCVSAEGNIFVTALADQELHVIAAGAAGAGTAAVSGNPSVIVSKNTVTAGIGSDSGTAANYANAYANGNIAVLASLESDIRVVSGSASGSGSAAVAAGVSTITMTDRTTSQTGRYADVTALANAPAVNFYSGSKKNKKNQYGLMIGAYHDTIIRQIVFAASGSGVAAVSPASATIVSKAVSTAKVGAYGKINQTSREGKTSSANQGVHVIAVNDSDCDAKDGGAAASGTVGVGAAAIVIVQSKETKALVEEGAHITAKADASILASSYNKMALYAAALGGGTVGVSGTADVVLVTDITLAQIANGTAANKTVINGKNISVKASSEQELLMNAGTISAGVASVGAGTVVLQFNGKTKAYVGTEESSSVGAANVELQAMGAVDVSAISKETSTAYVCGIGGGVANVGGSAAVLIMNVTTQAMIGNGAAVNCAGKLSVTAQDTSTVTGLGGKAGGGVADAGGAVVVILYRNTVTAGIIGGSVTAGSINILAKAERTIDAKAFAAGGGVASVNGSVVVISVGKSTSDSNTSTALGNTISNAQSDVNGSLKDNSRVSENYDGNFDPNDVKNIWSGISMDLNSLFTGSGVADKVSAFIAGGTVETANSGISIKAEDSTIVNAIAGAASGGVAAIGGAVVIVTLNGTAEAYGAGTLTSAGNIDILANETLTMNQMLTVSGSGGAVGLGGSVAVLGIYGTTQAALKNANVTKAGAVGVKAIGNLQVKELNTVAGSVGAAGIGAAYAQMNLEGYVNAYLLAGAVKEAGVITVLAQQDVSGKLLDGNVAAGIAAGAGAALVNVNVKTTLGAYVSNVAVTRCSSLDVKALENLSLDVSSYGLAAGGLGAATGTTADVKIAGIVNAYVAENSNVTTTGNVTVQAALQLKKLNVAAQGAGGALGAAGSLTLLSVTVTPNIGAYIKVSTVKADGNVAVLAYYNKEAVTYQINGAAGAAAAGAAGSGISIRVSQNGNVSAYLANSTITAVDVSVVAYGYTNLTVNCGTGSMALGFSVGGASVGVSDTMSVNSNMVNSIVNASGDVCLQAAYAGTMNALVKGAAGGLLASGTAQSSEITSTVIVEAYVSGGKVTAGQTFDMHAQRKLDITANVSGYSAAAFAAGGLTKSTVTVKAGNVSANLKNSANITAGGAANINANNTISVNNSGYASSAALGGSANDVGVTNTINLGTGVDIAQSCVLTGASINIHAASVKYYRSYASSITGGIAALGISTAVQNVTDDVYVLIRRGSSLTAQSGDLLITADSGYRSAPVCEAKGGKGGLVAGMSVKAEMNQNVKSRIETFTAGNGVTAFKAISGDVQLLAQSDLKGSIKSSIAFGVDAISEMYAHANTTNTVESYIWFGESIEVTGVDVTLLATVKNVDVSADTRAETVSALHTKLRPEAYMNNTIKSWIKLQNNDELTASDTLTIQALVEKVKAATYSTGDTKGVTGSVVSRSTNYTNVNSNVTVIGANTKLRGRSVLIYATAANNYRNNTVNYSNKAEYKAYTATEFVKQTVERVTTVVETVTEKICKWLPWPLNKIVKWIVKTVVKVVRWFEEILVEKILQSDTDAISGGSFTSSENVHLEGHIYYGSNSPADIIIDANGNISNRDVTYTKTGDTIDIKSFKSSSEGQLLISSQFGKVDGNVTIHSNSLLSALTITNNSDYHLKLGDTLLSSNIDPNACNYQIVASENALEMTDVVDLDTAPVINIYSNKGKNLIFAGEIGEYSAVYNLYMNGGNVYWIGGAKIIGNQFTVTDAGSIGTADNPLSLNMFINQKSTAEKVLPKINLGAAKDVYVSVRLMQYVDNRDDETPVQIKSLSSSDMITVSAGGTADIILNGAMLLVAETKADTTNTEYTYDKVVVDKKRIDEEIELYAVYDRQKLEGLEVRYNSAGEVEYWLNGTRYTIPDGYDLIIEAKEGSMEYWLVSNVPIEKYYVYKGTSDRVQLAEGGQIVWLDGTTVDAAGNTEAEGYYIISIRTERVTDILNTEYVDGAVLTETPVEGIYRLAVIGGRTVFIRVDGTRAHTELWTDKTVTGTDSVTIQGSGSAVLNLNNAVNSGGTILIKGTENTGVNVYNTVSSVNGNVTVSTAVGTTDSPIRTLIGENGQLKADKGTVNVTTGQLVVLKTMSSTGTDISGRHIVLNLNKDCGSDRHPIRVSTGADGISANVPGNLYLYSANDLVLDQLKASDLVNIRCAKAVVLKNGHRGAGITASGLVMDAGFVGTQEAPVTVSIGSSGMDVTAAGDIYLTQKEQTGYLNNIISNDGNVKVLADGQGTDGNLYIRNVSAGGQADIQSLHGSLIYNRTDSAAAVTADTIVLNASANIGAADRYLIIELGRGRLTVNAGGNLYLKDQSGNVAVDTVSAGGRLFLTAEGDILNGNTGGAVNVTGNEVTLISGGNAGAVDMLLKVASENALTIQAEKGIYLYHVGDASHVNLSGKENITFKADGTILLDSVKAGKNGEYDAEIISVGGSILDCKSHKDAAVTANNITLTALNGAIGSSDSSDQAMLIALGSGTLTVSAKNNITLKDLEGAVQAKSLTSTAGSISLKTAGDANLGVLNAGKQITVIAGGSILNGMTPGSADTNLTAKNLVLTAAGRIGAAGKAVTVDTDTMTAHAALDIYLDSVNTGEFTVTEMESINGNISMNTNGEVDIVKMEAASGNITMDIAGSAKLGELKGSTASGTISIKASQDIVNRDVTGIVNLLADAIVLNAGGTIGSGNSPVRTDANDLTGEAGGNIWMTDVNGPLTVHGLKSKTGGITLITNGDTRITSMEADKEIQMTAQSGNIILTSLITNQKATVTAAAGSILRDTDSASADLAQAAGNVRAADITLSAKDTIGAADAYLTTDLGTGVLNAQAEGNMYLREVAGDVRIGKVTSTGGSISMQMPGNISIEDAVTAQKNIDIIVTGTILNGRSDEGTNLKGENITLTANGLGTAAKPVTVSTGNGSLNIQSKESIWVTGQETTLNLGQLAVENGDVNLNLFTDCVNSLSDTSKRNIAAQNLIIAANGYSIGSGSKAVTMDLAANGTLTVTGAKNVNLSEKDALYAKRVEASGSIRLNAENGDVRTEKVSAKNVTILASGQILGVGTIPVGSGYVTGTNIVLEAGKGIGRADAYYLIDTVDDGAVKGNVTARATENIYLREVNGDLHVKAMNGQSDIYVEADQNLVVSHLETSADVTLRAGGAILSGSDTLTNVSGKNLILRAKQGTIGTKDAELTLKQLAGGSLTAQTVADQDIWLKGVDGGLNILSIQAGSGVADVNDLSSTVSLKAEGNIISGRTDGQAAIRSGHLYLGTETGDVGAEDKALRIDLSDQGRLDMDVAGSAWLKEKSGSVKLGVICVDGEEFTLTVPQNIFTALTLRDLEAGISNITANSVHLVSENGQIGDDGNPGQNYLEEDYAGWITTSCNSDYRFNAQAKGDIYIREIAGSLNVGEISAEGDVSVSAKVDLFGNTLTGKNVYAETTDGDISVSVDAKEDVVINSCGNIRNMNPDAVAGVDEILIKGNNITLLSRDGSIGSADSYIDVDLAPTGFVNAIAKGDIYISKEEGNLNVGNVNSQTGNVGLHVENGSIYADEATEDSWDIFGKDIILIAKHGAIGTKERPVILDSDGVVTLEAKDDIVLTELNGDLVLDNVVTQGDITLTADESIKNSADRDNTKPTLTGKDLNLTAANGSIGEKDNAGNINPVTVKFLDEGTFTGTAKDSVYLEAMEGNLNLNTVTAADEVILKADNGDILNGIDSTEPTANLTAANVELTSGGNIGTADKSVVTKGGTLLAQAENDIYLESEEDLYVRTMESLQGDITLFGKANIYSALDESSDGANLIANNITIKSDASVGASDHYFVTDLREAHGETVGKLNAETEINLYLRERAGDLAAENLTAGKDIYLDRTSGNAEVGLAKAGQNLTISNVTGDVTIAHLTVGNNLYMEKVKGDVVLPDAAIAGSITLKDINGFVNVKSGSNLNIIQIDTDKNIDMETTQSVTVSGTGLISGNNLNIKAGGSIGSANAKLNADISGNVTIKAGADIYYNEKDTIYVDSIKAGGVADLSAGNAILMANGASDGVEAGNINLAAGNIGNGGTFLVTNITGNGSVNANASGSAYLTGKNNFRAGQIKAGLSAVIKTRGNIINAAFGTNVQAGIIDLNAGGAIGEGNALQVQSSTISAAAGSIINLASGGTMQITKMQAPSSITLKAANIYGGNISTGLLDMTASGNIGSQGNFLRTSITTLQATAGGYAGIRNSGNLRIVRLNAFNAVVDAAHITTADAVNANTLELRASTGIGDGMNAPFLSNVNVLTGSTVSGSIYFRNQKSLTVQNLTAPQMIYLAAAGRVSGSAGAVTADTFVFDVQGLEIGTNVNAAEGISTAEVILSNAKDLTVGGIVGSYRGIRASGRLKLNVSGNLSIAEDLETEGELQLTAVNDLNISDGLKVTGRLSVLMQAGRNLIIPAGASVYTNGSATMQITGSGNTLMDILGKITASETYIKGAKKTNVNVSSEMGDISIEGQKASGGELNLTTTGKGEHILVYAGRLVIDSQKIQLSKMNTLNLHNPSGNNQYDFYDTPCTMSVYSGTGNDVYQIGMLNAGENGVRTTEGILTPGNSHTLLIQDEGGSNHYSIYSAQAPLTVKGGSGEDVFVVKTFVQILENGKLVPYQNAKMILDGGGGNNRLEVVKSAWFDKIMMENSMLSGSGLDIHFDNMDDVAIVKYSASENAEDLWTVWGWIWYNIMQLAERGILYVIIAMLMLMAAGFLIFAKKRRKKQMAA